MECQQWASFSSADYFQRPSIGQHQGAGNTSSERQQAQSFGASPPVQRERGIVFFCGR